MYARVHHALAPTLHPFLRLRVGTFVQTVHVLDVAHERASSRVGAVVFVEAKIRDGFQVTSVDSLSLLPI